MADPWDKDGLDAWATPGQTPGAGPGTGGPSDGPLGDLAENPAELPSLRGTRGKYDTAIQVYLQRKDGSDRHDRITKWIEYSVKMGFRNPVHTFHLIPVASPAIRKLISPAGGQRVVIKHGDDLQMVGYTNERSRATRTGNMDLQLTGVSSLGVAANCAIPLKYLNLRESTLLNRATDWLDPWMPKLVGVEAMIPYVATDAAASRYMMAGAMPKRSTKAKPPKQEFRYIPNPEIGGAPIPVPIPFKPPKATAGRGRSYGKFGKRSPWFKGTRVEALKQTRLSKDAKILGSLNMFAEQIGAHVWQAVDGGVLISRPTYDFDATAYGEGIVAHYQEGRGITGGNCMATQVDTSIANRFARYRIASAVKARRADRGESLYHNYSIDDPGEAFWLRDRKDPTRVLRAKLPKPGKINAGGRLNNRAVVSRIARTRMLERCLGGLSMKYQMDSHYSPTGVHWCQDTMVPVHDEVHGIYETMFLDMVELRYTRAEGQTATLTVMPADMWLGRYDLDAVTVEDFNTEMRLRCWW
jgi:prophage tail gpP-like protein